MPAAAFILDQKRIATAGYYTPPSPLFSEALLLSLMPSRQRATLFASRSNVALHGVGVYAVVVNARGKYFASFFSAGR